MNVGTSDEQLSQVLRPVRDQSIRAAQARGDTCPICMEPFDSDGETSRLPCGCVTNASSFASLSLAVPLAHRSTPSRLSDGERPPLCGSHMFKVACVAQHLRQHRSCPICRADCVETKPPMLSPLAAWRVEQQERIALKVRWRWLSVMLSGRCLSVWVEWVLWACDTRH